MKGDRLRPLDLHDDSAFQHVNECVRVMPMDGVRSARSILHDQHRALLARKVGQITRHQRRHLRGFLSGDRSGEAEEECAREQKSMHDANPCSSSIDDLLHVEALLLRRRRDVLEPPIEFG